MKNEQQQRTRFIRYKNVPDLREAVYSRSRTRVEDGEQNKARVLVLLFNGEQAREREKKTAERAVEQVTHFEAIKRMNETQLTTLLCIFYTAGLGELNADQKTAIRNKVTTFLRSEVGKAGANEGEKVSPTASEA